MDGQPLQIHLPTYERLHTGVEYYTPSYMVALAQLQVVHMTFLHLISARAR